MRYSPRVRSEEHTSELQSRPHLVCRLLLEKKKDARLLFSVAGDGLPDPAVARGRGARCREGRGGKEGLRDHRRGVFFFNDTATTEIYTLSLHDALPIQRVLLQQGRVQLPADWNEQVDILLAGMR